MAQLPVTEPFDNEAPAVNRNKVLVLGAVAAALGAVFICVILVLAGLEDFDLGEYGARDHSFAFSGQKISGTLHLPANPDPPLVLLVHGDGAADRYHGGAYLPLINSLLDGGIAVYSWDKPGIGNSEGNWLTYSMQDRADLATAALLSLKTLPGFQNSRSGFLGFSQAGWVLPIVAEDPSAADFIVLVGGAVNWRRQGLYYTRRRLQLEGRSEEEIADALAVQRKNRHVFLDEKTTYQDYLAAIDGLPPMTEHRYGFVRRNIRSDSTANLGRINIPVLTLHGDDDLNVDPVANSEHYQSFLQDRNPANRFHVVEGATHALLRAGPFNYQLAVDMPFWSQWAFLALGREAYAPGVLDMIVSWIKQQAEAPAPAIRRKIDKN